jgi:hypothetical protein
MKGEPQVVEAAGRVAADLVNLNLQGFVNNLVAVTTGNIFGGGFLVAAVYWFIYRRPKVRAAEESDPTARQTKAQPLTTDRIST